MIVHLIALISVDSTARYSQASIPRATDHIIRLACQRLQKQVSVGGVGVKVGGLILIRQAKRGNIS